ncbi:MAG: LLM class flavin-dependent oxidoreductase [Actinomycetota bacterium]|nr:LLM class flavin-dependent oxidoreductase [Actinomycetota bacterium]
MRHALYLPPFGELADPRAMVDLAVAADGTGWDGLFLWDHLLRPPDEPSEIADVWVLLSAIALSTNRLRLGPMVTPITRRRPQKLARESVTLDHLSAGRLTLGLGLGVDHGGELSRFAEVTDARARGDRLDEGADLLGRLWSGDLVEHRGPAFIADGVRFLPRPMQLPSIPIWMAARGDATRPVRRAARFDGLFPIEVDADGLARMVDVIVAERGSIDDFDIAVLAHPGVDLPAMAERGATWAMWSFLPGESVAEILPFIEAGPPA